MTVEELDLIEVLIELKIDEALLNSVGHADSVPLWDIANQIEDVKRKLTESHEPS